jgi:hypothetical protein
MITLTARLTWLLAALATLLLSACTGTGTSKVMDARTPEQIVAERAALHWQAKMEGRWADVYALLTPGYREANTLEAFQANFLGSSVTWKSFEVAGVTCDSAERCVASVRVEFALTGGMPGVPNMASTQAVQETWLLIDGSWQHLPRR